MFPVAIVAIALSGLYPASGCLIQEDENHQKYIT